MTAESGTAEMIQQRNVPPLLAQAGMDIASIQEGMAELSSKLHNLALFVETLEQRIEELEKGDYE